jgi:hypothetical protein
MRSINPYFKLRFLFVILLNIGLQAHSQTIPYAERLINLRVSKQAFTEVFKLISAQSSVVFSYTQNFNDKQIVSINCSKKPLRLVLSDLLKETNCTYKLKDKYIIIKCEAKPLPPPSIITGYIYNANDSTPLPDASIYVKQTRQASVSNSFGYFKLSYTNKLPTLSVSFAKETFKDTSLVVYNESKKTLSIYLFPKPNEKTIIKRNDTLVKMDSSRIAPLAIDSSVLPPSKLTSFFNRLKRKNPNIRNISDTLFSNFSIGLVPKISTNSLLSFNTINKFSLNILVGYSKGINGAEIAGVANIDYGDVKYVQIGGAINVVLGNVKGVQIAGAINATEKNTLGAQIAGAFNINRGKLEGLQISGVLNYNRKLLTGAQIAGFGNITKTKVTGMQISGFFNHSKKAEGAQIAGCYNLTDSITGLQLAGLFNAAKFVKGMQLAPFNFADSVAGIPFGIFSYVKKGYHKLEVASDEIGFTTIGFGTGVEKFHNVIMIGGNYRKTDLITASYGLASNFKLSQNNYLAVSVSQHYIHSLSNTNQFYFNSLSKAYIGFERKINTKLRIGAGPTFNVLTSDLNDPQYIQQLNTLPLYQFYNQNFDNSNIKMWIGGSIHFKFL